MNNYCIGYMCVCIGEHLIMYRSIYLYICEP